MDPTNEPLQGAPRHLRKPRFYAVAAQPMRTESPSPGQDPTRAALPEPKKARGISHQAKRRIALGLIVFTLLAITAMVLALLLWQ